MFLGLIGMVPKNPFIHFLIIRSIHQWFPHTLIILVWEFHSIFFCSIKTLFLFQFEKWMHREQDQKKKNITDTNTHTHTPIRYLIYIEWSNSDIVIIITIVIIVCLCKRIIYITGICVYVFVLRMKYFQMKCFWMTIFTFKNT